MLPPSRILVVAATARELGPAGDWDAVLCGVGPVDAAAATAAAIAQFRPAAIVHVGIAGARHAAGIAPLSMVVGTESRYCDLAVPTSFAPAVLRGDATLLAAVQRAHPTVFARPIGTSARVGGSVDCDVEAMEGFGVLRAAQLAGIPAVEVRCISNAVEERDRARWHFEAAFAALIEATPAIVAEVARCGR